MYVFVIWTHLLSCSQVVRTHSNISHGKLLHPASTSVVDQMIYHWNNNQQQQIFSVGNRTTLPTWTDAWSWSILILRILDPIRQYSTLETETDKYKNVLRLYMQVKKHCPPDKHPAIPSRDTPAPLPDHVLPKLPSIIN